MPATTTRAATATSRRWTPAPRRPASSSPDTSQEPAWSRPSTPSSPPGCATTGRPRGAPGRQALPLAGDDPEAKALVARLIDEMGFEPVDTGSLAEGGRRQQPGSPIYGRPLGADEMRASPIQ